MALGMRGDLQHPLPAIDDFLVSEAVRSHVIIRGLRAISDFEYEFQMTLMNRRLDEDIETVFLTPREEYTYVASRLIKEVAAYGGNVEELVPPPVALALKEKLRRQA